MSTILQMLEGKYLPMIISKFIFILQVMYISNCISLHFTNNRQVDRSWLNNMRNFSCSGEVSPRQCFASLKLNKLICSLLFFPMVLLAIALNLIIIALLLFGLVLTIPVAVLVFLYNLKRYLNLPYMVCLLYTSDAADE